MTQATTRNKWSSPSQPAPDRLQQAKCRLRAVPGARGSCTGGQTKGALRRDTPLGNRMFSGNRSASNFGDARRAPFQSVEVARTASPSRSVLTSDSARRRSCLEPNGRQGERRQTERQHRHACGRRHHPPAHRVRGNDEALFLKDLPEKMKRRSSRRSRRSS